MTILIYVYGIPATYTFIIDFRNLVQYTINQVIFSAIDFYGLIIHAYVVKFVKFYHLRKQF